MVNTVSQCQLLFNTKTSLFTGFITKVKDTLATQNDQKDYHILNVGIRVFSQAYQISVYNL